MIFILSVQLGIRQWHCIMCGLPDSLIPKYTVYYHARCNVLLAHPFHALPVFTTVHLHSHVCNTPVRRQSILTSQAEDEVLRNRTRGVVLKQQQQEDTMLI